ncbi:MAG: hypothetical protein JSS02_30770 [Planctomycetes bacterium]|nr:hypothetical protein [Planctomycetota bacterium]
MPKLSPACPKCQNPEFELWFLPDESVGAARCIRCADQYLLLDSRDYWFDVIQKGYPRQFRCPCRWQTFRLRIEYSLREEGEIRSLFVHSLCANCGKTRRNLRIDLDYAPTLHLLKKPLDRCQNPKVLYDLHDLSLFVTAADIQGVVRYLAESLGCQFVVGRRGPEGCVHAAQSLGEVLETVVTGTYTHLYAMPRAQEIPGDAVATARREDAFWKREEVVRLSSRSHVCRTQVAGSPPGLLYSTQPPTSPSDTELGLQYYLRFSNEFVRGEQVVAKSAEFRQLTTGLMGRLREQFVSWRGPHSFDNPEVHTLVFGDRFQKKSKSSKAP